MRRDILLVIHLLFALTCTSSPAWAITAEDVMEKMGKDERWGYLTGLVDMMSYQEVLNSNDTRAQCIVDWFYDDEATIKRVFATLLHFPDKSVEGILFLMGKKACGTPDSAPQQSGK